MYGVDWTWRTICLYVINIFSNQRISSQSNTLYIYTRHSINLIIMQDDILSVKSQFKFICYDKSLKKILKFSKNKI